MVREKKRKLKNFDLMFYFTLNINLNASLFVYFLVNSALKF